MIQLLLELTTAIRLSAKGKGNSINRDRHTAARAAATRVHGQVVRTPALTATSRVALRVAVAAHIGPLAQRGLAEEDGAGLAQPLDDKGIARHDASQEGPAARRRLEVVLGGDIVLDCERDAVQGAAHAAGGSLGVHLRGNCQSVGVHLQQRAVYIDQLSSTTDEYLTLCKGTYLA